MAPALVADARVEDLEWMDAHGESLSGAARRLGLTTASLERYLHRHRRHDLVARLRARDTERLTD